MTSVPEWNPINPLDYFKFIKWWWTYSDRISASNSKDAKLDLTQRHKIESRLLRFLPWFLLAFSFGTVIFYNATVDIFLFTHPDIHLVESSIRSKMGLLLNSTNIGSSSNDTLSSESNEQTMNATVAEGDSKQNTTGKRQYTLADHLHASHRYPLSTMMTGLLIITVLVVYTASSHASKFRGLPRILVAYFAASLLQSKILFWMDDKWVLICFLLVRIAETGIVLSVASQMVTHMAVALPLFATPAAAGLSLFIATLTRLSTVELTWVASLFGPLHLIVVVIMYLRIPKSGSRSAILQGKISMISITFAPFCIAAFGSTLYQWSHLFGPSESVPSYHNVLVVSCLAFVIGQAIFWSTHLMDPAIASKAGSVTFSLLTYSLPFLHIALAVVSYNRLSVAFSTELVRDLGET